MKILYVGTERDEAQAIATAVRHLDESVRVSWTSRLDQVANWVDETAGRRALVVEADSNGPAWRSVLAYAAGLRSALPIVVIVPEGTGSDRPPLTLGAHDCIARNPSLLRDLPAAITRAIDRARDQDQERLERVLEIERAARADTEQRLVQATAALREGEGRHQLAIAAAAEQLARSQSQYAVGMARAAATRDMVDEQFREAAIEVERARRSHAAAVADAARLAQREEELSALLSAATATQREFRRTISEEIDKRRAAEAMLGQALTARDAAEELHASAMTVAAAQSRELQAALSMASQELESKAADLKALAAREAELTSMLASATASRETIERRLEATKNTLLETEARARRELLAGEQAAARAAQLEEQLRQERAALATATGELADRQAQFDRERAQAESARAGLTAELRDVEAARADLIGQLRAVEEARDEARRDHRSAVADVARLTERESILTSELADRQAQFDRERAQAESERAGLTGQLRGVEAARDQAQRDHQSAAADVARLAEREAVLTSELADRQAQFDRERAQAESERAGLTGELRDVEAARADLTGQLRAVEEARDEAQRDHQSAAADVARLAAREAVLTSELADRQAQFDRERAQAESERAGLTGQLRGVEEARDQAQREHQSAVAEITRLTGCAADLTSELADVWAAQRTLELRLAEVVRASNDAAERAAAERDAAAERQTDLEARLAGADETVEGLQRSLAETRAAALEAERLLTEEADALRAAALVQAAQFDDRFDEQRRNYEGRLAEGQGLNNTLSSERDGLLQSLRTTQEESSRLDREHRAARECFEQAHAEASAAIQQLTAERQEIEARFEVARTGFQDSLDRLALEHAAVLSTREIAIEELRVSLTACLAELEVTRRQRDVLQPDADELPGVQQELLQSRADNHRLFQQASLPMFRCTKDGALTQANRILTALVGLRSADELGGAAFAASVFESPNDLSWLIERCLGSRGKETTETTWRRKDGTRLLVRLSACATSSDLIECGVEDLTPVRVLQDRLSQAHRMEAVGRLAAEVAVTCGNLLRGVHQNTQEWLMTDGSHAASRQRGEMLLEEMSRAAGLLSQLAAYGDEESRRPAAVELSAVVRDIAPVLKRVAGDAVEVQLPAASTRLNVDASAERVQRLLVNLAAYGRERMPRGGRLKIELGTIVVDRHFTAKHPNVRLGPHALVTVTESRRTTQAGGPLQLHDSEAGSGPQGSVAVQPTVDLGTLQELVGECGGHLWMTVQPLGDMLVKIRLPLLTSYGQPAQPASVAGGRVRTIASWFQH